MEFGRFVAIVLAMLMASAIGLLLLYLEPDHSPYIDAPIKTQRDLAD